MLPDHPHTPSQPAPGLEDLLSGIILQSNGADPCLATCLERELGAGLDGRLYKYLYTKSFLEKSPGVMPLSSATCDRERERELNCVRVRVCVCVCVHVCVCVCGPKT